MEIFFAVLVILFGFTLILADILFIPGGVVGILGGVFVLGAIGASYKVLGSETALLLGSGSVILAATIAFVGVKFKLWKTFVRQEGQERGAGFSAHGGDLQGAVGKEGEVSTDLHPAGTVVVEGKKYDAVAEGGFIEKGKRIWVVSVSTGQIKVREVAKEVNDEG